MLNLENKMARKMQTKEEAIVWSTSFIALLNDSVSSI